MNKNHKNKRKGFTLLEILLVIAAIGILAAIVLVAINPTRQIAQVRNAQRRSDINAIYKALEQYLIDNKTYPTDITDSKKVICDTGSKTTADTLAPIDCTGKADLRVLVPTYIAAIPKDPSGGVYEVYRNPANNRIGIEAPDSELGQNIAINIITTIPTPEELIQAQITAGTLVPTATQQLVEGRLVYKNNEGTQTYIDPATTTRTCPTGYIAVPGNSMYGTSDFCVAKYEMKAVAISAPTVGLTSPNTYHNTPFDSISNLTTPTTSANGRAIASIASGFPIAEIDQPTSADYCANQNTVSGASLISNAEWMTIARNIEAQLSNWTTGTAASSAIGIGGLYRGHTDKATDLGEYKFLVAGDDNNGYIGTGQSGFSIERRTHTLSNGEIIWDLSGNVMEYTSDTIMGVDKPNNGLANQWQEWTTITNFGTLSYDLTRPSNNTWNSTQNMGKYYTGELTGGPWVLIRGGWIDSDIAGIFALEITDPAGIAWIRGFRCVVR